MASGDAFVVKVEAGSGTTFSYTATADLVITCYGTESAVIQQGWVVNTSGVYPFLPNGSGAAMNMTNLNKTILKSGSTITGSDSDINTYGLWFGGFEL